MKLTLGEIAEKLELELRGDATLEITGLSNLMDAGPGQLAFLFNPAYIKQLDHCHAEAVILRQAQAHACNLPFLISSQPRLTWARLARLFDPAPLPDGRVHPTAVISKAATYAGQVTIGAHAVIEAGVRLDTGVTIGPGCFIGERTTIGENSRLAANVSLYHDVIIGNNAIVHSGVVIGADGFGFEFDADTSRLVKIPQIYSVIIGNDVEIGAGTTIDRGALNNTRLGDGTKLDNQVQVGHGTTIGANTAISGCTAIAGSTKIGANCMIGGAVGIVDNIEIVDEVEITAMTLVSQSIKRKGRYSSGTGLMPGFAWKRSIVGFARLDEILKRLRSIEQHFRK